MHNNKTTLFLSLFLLLAGVTNLHAQAPDTVYVSLADQPDGGYFLPAPPAVTDMNYVDDLLQWQWGKTQRPLARGTKASRESQWLPDIMRTIMAEVFDLDTISNERTPALSRLLLTAYYTGDQSAVAPKKKYMRIRPFMEMGEDTWAQYDDDYLRTNGSYPSGHTSFGWATALVMAEMWPELQDTILRRGFEFGENRIITGAHYQSDVNAGYMCAAGSIARAHTNPQLTYDIAAARAELIRLKGLPTDYNPVSQAGMPQGSRILNTPVDTASYRYLGDIMRYKKAKLLLRQDSVHLQQAIDDVKSSKRYLAKIFGQQMGIAISREDTPTLWQLLDTLSDISRQQSKAMKAIHFRKRPYVQMGDTTPVPAEEESHRDTSSFPSNHACLGWTLALALAEVAPEYQNDVLRRGFDYGDSRLLLGYHWASDIEASRLLASAIIARLHAEPWFTDLLHRARLEFLKAK